MPPESADTIKEHLAKFLAERKNSRRTGKWSTTFAFYDSRRINNPLVQEFETMSQAQAFALGYAESQNLDASQRLFLVCVEPGTSIAYHVLPGRLVDVDVDSKAIAALYTDEALAEHRAIDAGHRSRAVQQARSEAENQRFWFTVVAIVAVIAVVATCVG